MFGSVIALSVYNKEKFTETGAYFIPRSGNGGPFERQRYLLERAI